jgi:hypothetical protein
VDQLWDERGTGTQGFCLKNNNGLLSTLSSLEQGALEMNFFVALLYSL